MVQSNNWRVRELLKCMPIVIQYIIEQSPFRTQNLEIDTIGLPSWIYRQQSPRTRLLVPTGHQRSIETSHLQYVGIVNKMSHFLADLRVESIPTVIELVCLRLGYWDSMSN